MKFSKSIKFVISFIAIILIISITNVIYANDAEINTAYNELEKYLSDSSSISSSEMFEMYTELSEKYSNQDIAKMIQDNKEEIINKSGIDNQTLNKGTDILRSLDTEETKKILNEDLNVEEIKEKLDNGYTLTEIVDDIQEQMPTSQKVSIGIRLLLASGIVKTILIVLVILVLYTIIIRWLLFKKAGKHGWAILIPIYNEITYLKVSGVSPWWMLVLLIPVIGLIFYLIVKFISRFTLSVSFDKGFLFGIGLFIFGVLFETILVANKNIEYVGY